MAARTLRSCAHCGNEFIPEHWGDPRFCCIACFSDSRPVKSCSMNCLQCNSVIQVHDSRLTTTKYCSKECMWVHKRTGRPSHISCQCCGIEFTPLRWMKTKFGVRYNIVRKATITCTDECRSKVLSKKLKLYTGASKGAWKGGLTSSYSGYRGPKWAQIAESVRKRDGYVCQRCGLTQDQHIEKHGRRLPVHHIVPFHNFQSIKKANQRTNLTTLCSGCHMIAEYETLETQMTFCFYNKRNRSRLGLAIGSKHGQAKFTEVLVIEIRRRYRNGEMMSDLAKEFNTNHVAMAKMIDGRHWSHVPNPVPLRGRKEAYVAKREWLKSQQNNKPDAVD